MSEFRIDTPSNIDVVTDAEIMALCRSDVDIKSPKVRIKIIKLLYKILGYDLSPDLLYALADESKEQFILALAGGGKTTAINVKIALQKTYRSSKFTSSGKLVGNRVLSLVYNKANVDDMVNKHRQVISVFNSIGIEGLNLDYDIECKTMHSFCRKWIKEYSESLGLLNYTFLEDARKNSMISTAITNVCKKANIEKIPKGLTVNSVVELHNYIVETKSSLEDLRDSEKVVDMGVDIEIIKKILLMYANVKKIARKFDYTDLLIYFKKLLDENEEARLRIQNYYDYITADEIQDFTPLLMDILKSIVGDHTSLVCIGDDDQSIYAFRGADNNNALRFKDIFPKATIHLLKTNRRCPSNILSMADSIIRLNEDRFQKEMKGVKGPGNVTFRAYNDRIGQYISIVNQITSFSDADRTSTVVGYREKYSSLVLSTLLYESNMPFHVISGYGPFDYELFGHFISVMNALNSCGDKRALMNLYKVLPVSRAEMQEALHYDSKNDRFTDGQSFVDIDKIEFSPVRMKNEIFRKTFSYLVTLSKHIEQLPVNRYAKNVIGFIQRNFYNFVSRDSNLDPDIGDFCLKKCLEFFDRNANYREVYAFYRSEKERLSKWNEQRVGPGLSTFHSLKGLEFDNVILCDLAESIFPNYSAIDFRPYDDLTKKSLKECENRLMYVAVTRSKKNIWFFYSKSDPSYYISLLKDTSRTEAEMSELYNDEGVAEVVINQSNIFGDIDNYVTEQDDTNEVVINPDDVTDKQEVEELDEGVTIKSKEVKNTYSNDYRNNLMNSLFRKTE